MSFAECSTISTQWRWTIWGSGRWEAGRAWARSSLAPTRQVGHARRADALHKLKVFVFLPPDWSQKRRDCFERVTGFQVTESIAEAQAAAWGNAAPTITHEAKPSQWARSLGSRWTAGNARTLPNRLYAALVERKLKRTDLARIFGVHAPP